MAILTSMVPSGASAGAVRACGVKLGPARGCRVAGWTRRLPTIPEERPEGEDAKAAEAAKAAVAAGAAVRGGAALAEELGDPLLLREGRGRAARAAELLDGGSRWEQQAAVAWLADAAVELSLSKRGSRVVQRALEVASGPARCLLVARLRPRAPELVTSPHGNFVLAKMVEVLPSPSITPVLVALAGRGAELARHQYGCRVLERIMEHCLEEQKGALVEEILADAHQLCRHRYGNFVVQSVLEHGGAASGRLLERLLPVVPELATHRTGSHVVKAALMWCDERGQRAVGGALLRAPLAEIARDRFGRHVAEELAGAPGLGEEARAALAQSLPKPSSCEAGQCVIGSCGLAALAAAGVAEERGWGGVAAMRGA